MSWRDRAVAADSSEAPSSGSDWRSRATVEPQANDGGGYWQDVAHNALDEVKAIPGGVKSMFEAVSPPSIPAMGRSIYGIAKGTPPEQTEMGQDAQRKMDFLKSTGKGIWQGVKDTGKTAMMPLEMASGTPAADTMAGKSFRQRPIGTVAGVASTVFPLARAGRAAFATEGPNLLESAGARGMLKDAGIGEDTIGNLTKRGAPEGQMPPNPVDVGENLGGELANKGIVGGSGKSNFNNFMKQKMTAGQAVKESAQAIRKANSGLGEYPELEDSLKVQAVPTLKPILDEANQIAQSGYDRPAARMMKRLYDNLQTKANANNGFLTLDHIDEEMGHVGKLFGNAARGTDKWQMVAKVYGKLAGIRDSMVSDIAETAGVPELKQNFLKANADYSKMMRIEPDIRSAANAEAVKSPFEGMKHPIDATHKLISKGVYNAGRVGRRIFEPMKGGVANEKGSIFPGPEEEGLPIVQPDAEALAGKGQPYALYIGDQEGVGPMYNVYGEHPTLSTGRYNHSTVAADTLKKEGIPIKGRQPPRGNPSK